MKIGIDQIQVAEDVRIRQETGDISSLADSISKVGLINPIIIDEDNNLIAGYRRLCACRSLGWKEVEVKMVVFKGDQIKMHEIEVAENFFRKDFTVEEVLSTERRRLQLLEQQRKKGFFEKLWLWLKGLFVPKPVADPQRLPPINPPVIISQVSEEIENEEGEVGDKVR